MLSDAQNLTSAPGDKRYFIYDESVLDENIIALWHYEGNGIFVDIAPSAKDVNLHYSCQSLFTAFYHLDAKITALAT